MVSFIRALKKEEIKGKKASTRDGFEQKKNKKKKKKFFSFIFNVTNK